MWRFVTPQSESAGLCLRHRENTKEGAVEGSWGKAKLPCGGPSLGSGCPVGWSQSLYLGEGRRMNSSPGCSGDIIIFLRTKSNACTLGTDCKAHGPSGIRRLTPGLTLSPLSQLPLSINRRCWPIHPFLC